MGFSLAAAAAIIGVSVLIAIELVVGSLLPAITDINNSYDDMKERAIEQIQTDINITTVSITSNGSFYDHNFTVENTGSIDLETKYFDILINGTSYPFNCSKSFIYPEQDVYFQVDNLAGDEDKRLKILTENGISDYFEYTVTQ
jgi:archaellum component FlaF (FlaF/FlaG flagellin family)